VQIASFVGNPVVDPGATGSRGQLTHPLLFRVCGPNAAFDPTFCQLSYFDFDPHFSLPSAASAWITSRGSLLELEEEGIKPAGTSELRPLYRPNYRFSVGTGMGVVWFRGLGG